MLIFNSDKHEYTLDGKKLISVTQLMSKYGLAPDYSEVDPEVLKRKAERGTLVHAEIEDYLKQNIEGQTVEMYNFRDYIKKEKVSPINSELMVNNDVVAGTIDLILFKDRPIIADIKTTFQLHKSAISWQLSIYLYLYLNMPDKDLTKKYDDCPYNEWLGQVYHFNNDGDLEVVDIPLQPYSEVEKLIECERTGTKFEIDVFTPYQVEIIKNVKEYMDNLQNQIKIAQEKYDIVVNMIKDEMEARELKEFTKGGVKIECKGGKKAFTKNNTRTYVDEELFAKEHPVEYEVYKKYIKTEVTVTPVKATPNKVTITILEEENGKN